MLAELVKKIKERKPKRVFIQLPEGLLSKAQELEEALEKEGIEVVISLEPCYGACDVRDCEAAKLGCDLLVHVGHANFGVKTEIPVLYYEWRINFDPKDVLEKNLEKLNEFEKIGLVSSVNFIDSLEIAKKFLESKGKKCFLEKGERTLYPGQILGCDVSAGTKIENLVDCFLFIGSGIFHPLGLALKVTKPVFSLNPEKLELTRVDAEKFFRQREVAKALSKESKTYGILVSTKPGQANITLAKKIKKELESKGKKCYLFAMDTITPEKLLGLNVDCYVNCACPRIAIENRTLFKKPIVNPEELM